MPTTAAGSTPSLDVHIRRAVWIAWTIALLVAAVIYSLKAADSRSAFVRWRHQVLEIGDGVNIWDRYYFPNPPILPLTLYPLMALPPVVGALAWYAIKVGMTTWSAVVLLRMARGRGRELAPWAVGLVLLLSFRPILSDLQHGNINLLILFLIVASLLTWRKGQDVTAGMILALAIAYKVTPGLFLPYFAYKRSWKAVGATLVGLVLFLLVIPGAVLGPGFNWQCLMKWRQNIISPFVEGDTIPSVQEVNQSMPGVVTRLLTQPKTEGEHNNGNTEHDLNLVSWDPERVAIGIKAVAVGFVLLLGWFCRTRAVRRDDPRLLGEFALVVLTMLFVSERSWKHHYVTLLLPYTYLVYQAVAGRLTARVRAILGASLAASALLMASTSSEIGDLIAGEKGHEVALYFGMFFWSGLVLYAATAWRVAAMAASEVAPDEETPVERPAARGPHAVVLAARERAA